MVVHQNITNLAGYFHFLNVRKIPYVIPACRLHVARVTTSCKRLACFAVAGLAACVFNVVTHSAGRRGFWPFR